MSPRKRSFFRVNRWPSIAASLQLHPHLLPSWSTKHAMRSRQPSRKLLLAQPGIRPPPLRAAAAFLAGSPADLPRWLLADAGAEVEGAPAGESAGAEKEASADGSAAVEPSRATAGNDAEAVRNDLELNEDQVAALASGFVEAKHEETQEEAEADAIVGGAEFDEEEAEEQAEVGTEEAEETQSAEVSELS